RIQRSPGAGSDSRRQPGDPVQLRQQLRAYATEPRAVALPVGKPQRLNHLPPNRRGRTEMLDANLSRWLEAHAEPLDRGAHDAEDVLPQLAASGLLGLGVGESLGGAGGETIDAVEAVAEVATYSLTSAFVLWGQRSFIEYLLHSENVGLRERLLDDLLGGRVAGATGLSNAMKFLSGIEQLGVTAQEEQDGWRLNGRMPWVTNLRKGGYVVAAAIELPGREPF